MFFLECWVWYSSPIISSEPDIVLSTKQAPIYHYGFCMGIMNISAWQTSLGKAEQIHMNTQNNMT
jgi:hypothetical protein